MQRTFVAPKVAPANRAARLYSQVMETQTKFPDWRGVAGRRMSTDGSSDACRDSPYGRQSIRWATELEPPRAQHAL